MLSYRIGSHRVVRMRSCCCGSFEISLANCVFRERCFQCSNWKRAKLFAHLCRTVEEALAGFHKSVMRTVFAVLLYSLTTPKSSVCQN